MEDATNTNANTDSTTVPEAVAQPKAGSSTRYQHFHTALVIASKKASNKWSYNDFSHCFPTWTDETPEGVAQIRIQVSQHMRDQTLKAGEEILESYSAAEAIDTLHEVIMEGRARNETAAGKKGKDVWRSELEPGAAVRARTVPVLRAERDRLLALLNEADSTNEELQRQIEGNRDARIGANAKSKDLLDALDKTVAEFSTLPVEDMAQWMVDRDEDGTT